VEVEQWPGRPASARTNTNIHPVRAFSRQDTRRYHIVTCLQVILTPTCRVSVYPRQVIEVDAA
jgi:hypothetical protein